MCFLQMQHRLEAEKQGTTLMADAVQVSRNAGSEVETHSGTFLENGYFAQLCPGDSLSRIFFSLAFPAVSSCEIRALSQNTDGNSPPRPHLRHR